MPPSRSDATARRILDIAQRLVQTRGFNGFSYADIAAELAVTKASLHYHFPTKDALGRALITRYREAFLNALSSIDADGLSAPERLSRYVNLYATVLSDDRMCLCGMVAAEYSTLPREMQEELRRFFTANETWLARVLEDGARARTLRLQGTSLDGARLVLGALEGAMLVARTYGSVAHFEGTARRLLEGLTAELPRKHARAGTRSKRAAKGPTKRVSGPRPKHRLPARARKA